MNGGLQRLSVVTPAFNESENLPVLYDRLKTVLDPMDLAWEWLVVDDHSTDGTYETVRRIAAEDSRVRCVRLSRNCGSHVSLLCGLQITRSDCAVVMAGDLQDPPETIPDLVARWRDGAQIVWAARATPHGESPSSQFFSKSYFRMIQRVIGETGYPQNGADFFLVDAKVIEALTQFQEHNVSTLMLINWLGFRQDVIEYEKGSRLHGHSGWTIIRKVKLVIDSLVSFSSLPIQIMSIVGFLTALLGAFYAAWITYHAIASDVPVQGWSSLMVVVLLLGGLQMLMLGVLGEYLWRASENARRRPLYMIEETTASAPERENE